jgi:methionyl-tRNA formyltransferase
MKILVLSPYQDNILQILRNEKNSVTAWNSSLSDEDAEKFSADIAISFGYRHILKPSVIEKFPHGVVNLHVSLLPWNRGADPNLWSFLEDTPKGVSLHYIDAGIDTGPLIDQRRLFFGDEHTLRTSYEILFRSVIDLFRENWPKLERGSIKPMKQPDGGSYHKASDKAPYLRFLKQGWDTPVPAVTGRALVTER